MKFLIFCFDSITSITLALPLLSPSAVCPPPTLPYGFSRGITEADLIYKCSPQVQYFIIVFLFNAIISPLPKVTWFENFIVIKLRMQSLCIVVRLSPKLKKSSNGKRSVFFDGKHRALPSDWSLQRITVTGFFFLYICNFVNVKLYN